MTAIGKVLVFTVLSAASSMAFSASVPAQYTACNGSDSQRAFGLTAATSCLAYGSGNINGNASDPFLTSTNGAGYEFISNTENSSAWTEVTSQGSSRAFSFSIDPTLWASYDSLAIGVKVGNNLDLSWAVWSVESLASAFEVFIAPKQGAGLSHFNIYGSGDGPGTGVDNPTPVPLPAAAWLFLSGLAGLVGFHKRKAAAKA
ncbi:MAG: hypothetical protein CME36_08800 [unclassified Hahellaceae]|nr:hypothetical protein [Hahellaceae bacterium]|tara:strand:+ start:4635 stop:5240 length:606 start_codon:yes stop_codon:yes gene_type:complete